MTEGITTVSNREERLQFLLGVSHNHGLGITAIVLTVLSSVLAQLGNGHFKSLNEAKQDVPSIRCSETNGLDLS